MTIFLKSCCFFIFIIAGTFYILGKYTKKIYREKNIGGGCVLRSYDVDVLRPGMKVGRDVLDMDGKVILKKNTTLNAEMIDSLIGHNIFSVYIDEVEEEETADISGQEHLLDQDYLEHYQKTYDKVYDVFYKFEHHNELDEDSLNFIIDSENVKELCDGSRAITQIHNMTRKGDYTIHHAANVGILAGIFAKWIRYNKEQTDDIIIAGILSEIGKVKVPKEILNKKGKLDPEEFAQIKRHVDHGYDMLKLSALKNKTDILSGVLHHHERCDGSGYPNRLKGEQISDFGKIIALLDIYDAMAANRSYAKRNSPFDIFKILYDDVLKGKLDTRFGILFMRNFRRALNGNWVGLSDGQRARIVYIDETRVIAQPIVQTVKNEFIDLNKTPDLKVEALLTAQEV